LAQSGSGMYSEPSRRRARALRMELLGSASTWNDC